MTQDLVRPNTSAVGLGDGLRTGSQEGVGADVHGFTPFKIREYFAILAMDAERAKQTPEQVLYQAAGVSSTGSSAA